MTFYSTQNSRPLGTGVASAPGSVVDRDLATLLERYKAFVAGRYLALTAPELAGLYAGPFLASPKVDGEAWFLLADGKDAVFANPRGRVISGAIPALDEARKLTSQFTKLTVIPGELFALRPGGRPRHTDIASALGGAADAQVERIGFFAYDIAGDTFDPDKGPFELYRERLARLQSWFGAGKRVQVVPSELVENPGELARIYDNYVSGDKAEGIVVRAASGKVYKVKPIIDLDVVIVGYTLRGEDPDQVRSLLVGVVRPDGNIQILGACGNLGDTDNRRALCEKVVAIECASEHREVDSEGVSYQFVRPEIVMQMRVNDVQSEHGDGSPIHRMVLEFASNWRGLRRVPGATILGPVFERLRPDKEVTHLACGVEQVLDRCLIPEALTAVERPTLPTSAVVRREVYVKNAKNGVAIRKLLVWKTNKEICRRRMANICGARNRLQPGAQRSTGSGGQARARSRGSRRFVRGLAG